MQNFQSGDSSDFHHQDPSTITNEQRRLDHRSDEITHNLNLEDSFNDSDEAHDNKVQAQVDKNTQYRHDLKQQCDDDTRRMHYQYEESRVEMRKMQDFERSKVSEDQRDLQYKHDESQKLNDDIQSFKKDCNDYRDMQKALINLEEQRIDGQQYEASDRSTAVLTERARQMKVKDVLNDKMCSQLLANEEDRQDREHELDVKHDDENRAKNLKDDMEAQDKWEGDRKDLRDGLLSQIEENKQSVRDEKQRDLVYRDQAYAIMEAEDEREKERARKKKEADDQHYADLRRQIQDNAERRLRQKQLDNEP